MFRGTLIVVLFQFVLVNPQAGLSFSFGQLSSSVHGPTRQRACVGERSVTALRAVYIGPSESNSGKAKARAVRNQKNQLLSDFTTASGEIINPYRVLKVSRTAEKAQIKDAYRTLSRKYHPDGFMQRNDGILPGSCNNLEDVRDEWERIKLSYEILTSKKLRARYDRNSAVADPGAAMGRAAGQAALWGLAGVGKGIFKVGSAVGDMAFGKGANKADD
uniref:J domain-containing protein n=1 Tax=Pseudictyota dubia TaxID=2749911 RepID=A0A7R9W201_9STRA|mmetsp:Transcript_28020/g.52171  ORF Transcript_28020/g.52171 Transcript_28020/m.52171 type:complete len:218 (+) Transcript_28020:273-926(+)